ncbi:LysR family transcriptional regulator [Candidatus Stoquefichus massiliensis]|uniref:LysR family transcriptional regulator n=1 Tax=Candidatus Stoquefichus massiliensis TaxID=1470350 RepID=UPI000482F7C2|nr:LysR family transcriptional regulator [Candidatus Stoquefichus massiliensis]
MIELEQLVHLIAFNEHKTLSNAAKSLHISQPVLTRSMQKLEDELDLILFERTKNRISLNATGLLAIEHAKRIINDTDNMKRQLKEFDRKQHTISIGSCAPAPQNYLNQKVSRFYPDKTISSEIKDMEILLKGLKENTYTFIITPYEIDNETIESIPFMEEQLFFSLPYDHPLAKKKSISLKEMDGGRMLLMSNIGFWNQMHQETMPHTKFLIQQDRSVFYDLIELSSLPSFTSDYSMKYDGIPPNRAIVPITDQQAHAMFYCCYLKEKESTFKSFLYTLNK